MSRFDVDITALRKYTDDLDHYEEQTKHHRELAKAAVTELAAWGQVGEQAGGFYDLARRGTEGSLALSARFLAGMRGRLVEAAEIYHGMDWEAKERFDALNKDLEDVSRGVRVGGSGIFGNIGQIVANPHGYLVPPPVLRGDFADFGKDAYARGKEQSVDRAGASSSVREIVTEGVAFVQECQQHVKPTVQDPLRFLAGIGLGFLLGQMTNVQDLVDWVHGDPDALRKAAGHMREIDEGVRELRSDFDRVTSTRLTGWNGAGAQAAKARLTDYAVGVSGTAFYADLVARLLEVSALMIEATYDALRAMVSDLAIQLVQLWVPALQAAATTMGASISAAQAITPAYVMSTYATVSLYVRRLDILLDKVGAVFNNLGSHFTDSVPRLTGKSKQPTVRDHRAPREDKRALKVIQ